MDILVFFHCSSYNNTYANAHTNTGKQILKENKDDDDDRSVPLDAPPAYSDHNVKQNIIKKKKKLNCDF